MVVVLSRQSVRIIGTTANGVNLFFFHICVNKKGVRFFAHPFSFSNMLNCYYG
jgi:hypothetical protein